MNILLLAICFGALTIPYHIKLVRCFNMLTESVKTYIKKDGARGQIELLFLGNFANIAVTAVPYMLMGSFCSALETSTFNILFSIVISFIAGLVFSGEKVLSIPLWFSEKMMFNDVKSRHDKPGKRYKTDGRSGSDNDGDNRDMGLPDSKYRFSAEITSFMAQYAPDLSLEYYPHFDDYAVCQPWNNRIVIGKLIKQDGFSDGEIIAILGHEIYHARFGARERFMLLLNRLLPLAALIVVMAIIFALPKDLPSVLDDLLALLLFPPSIVILATSFLVMLAGKRIEPQIIEMKCDRFSCELLEENAHNLKSAFIRMKAINDDGLSYIKKRDGKRAAKIDATRSGYADFKEHPNLDYRIRRIENRKPWNFFEYYKHAYAVLWRLITGKGWV